jgi:hypothetical protein
MAVFVFISMLLPLSVVQAGGDDDPITVTSVPRDMSYQGILKDSGGDPVTDSVYSVTFRIYNVASGGTSMWDETKPCTTSAGVFNASLSNVDLSFSPAEIGDGRLCRGIGYGGFRHDGQDRLLEKSDDHYKLVCNY